MCAEHDFFDELTHSVLQALITSVTPLALPPRGQERVASFYKLSFFGNAFGILRENFGGLF
jgi:hypothetical protein